MSVASNVVRYGNTNAASIPLCLSEYHEQGRLTYGERVLLVGFGAGFTMGAAYMTWSVPAMPVDCTGRKAFDRAGKIAAVSGSEVLR